LDGFDGLHEGEGTKVHESGQVTVWPGAGRAGSPGVNRASPPARPNGRWRAGRPSSWRARPWAMLSSLDSVALERFSINHFVVEPPPASPAAHAEGPEQRLRYPRPDDILRPLPNGPGTPYAELRCNFNPGSKSDCRLVRARMEIP
jgi:hypothetical protein